MDPSLSVIKAVSSFLKRCKGVCAVKPLTKLERQKILEIEKEEEKKSFMGASFENEGVRVALSRDVVMLMVTDLKYKYKEPTIVLKAGDEVVGEEIMDPKKLGELKRKPSHYLIGHDFIVYTHKLRKLRGRPLRFIMLPFSFSDERIKDIPGVRDPICGWPSRTADPYLKKLLNVETSDIKLGTVLVAFNIEKEKDR